MTTTNISGAPSASLPAKTPSWAVVVLVMAIILPMVFRVGPVTMSPHRLVLIILFIPLLGMLLGGRAGRLMMIDAFMFGSALWVGISFFANLPAASAIEPMGIYFIESFGAYLVGRVAIRSPADFGVFVKVFFGACLFLMPFAILEGLTDRNLLLDLLPSSAREVNIGKRMEIWRVQSAFAHPILFGAFVSTGMGLFWFALRPRAGFSGRFLTSLVSMICTFFSMSTGALIAVFVQWLVIGWELVTRQIKNRWRIFAAGGVSSYVVVDLMTTASPFHAIVNHVALNSGSAYNRILIFQFGMENVRENPVFGLGFADWERPSWMDSSIDNFWLMTAMRYGVPALVLLAIALVLLIRGIVRAQIQDRDVLQLRLGYMTALFGLIVAGGTVHYWQSMFSFLFLFFGAGIWFIGYRDDGTDGGDPPHGPSQGTAGPDTPRQGGVRYSRFTPDHRASARQRSAMAPHVPSDMSTEVSRSVSRSVSRAVRSQHSR